MKDNNGSQYEEVPVTPLSPTDKDILELFSFNEQEASDSGQPQDDPMEEVCIHRQLEPCLITVLLFAGHIRIPVNY